MGLDGLLLVDKPAGITSQTAVTKVRRALGADKAGHTGTLDPFATGLLLVCVGRATKLAGFLTVDDKGYRATVALGAATDTDDNTGKELSRADASKIDRAAVEAALVPLRGKILQRPPDFSAIQKDGERMYDRARRGEKVEIAPREVTVYRLELEDFTPGPIALATVSMSVSKGTYVRSIARDLGAALGVGGHLTALRRMFAGQYGIEWAGTIDWLENPESRKKALEHWATNPKVPPLQATWIPLDQIWLPMPGNTGAPQEIPGITVTADEAARLVHGTLPPSAHGQKGAQPGPRRLLAPDGRLLAIATVAADGKLTLDRVMVDGSGG